MTPGEDDSETAAHDDQPSSPATFFAPEPVGHQHHDRNIGNAAADPDTGIKKQDQQVTVTAGDSEHAAGDQQ